MSNAIIIGAGHNGLAAAFYLARAGLRPIVFERRDTIGGGAITGELHPGFHCPTLAHRTALWTEVASEMGLARHGLETLTSEVDVCAPSANGRTLVLSRDVNQASLALTQEGVGGAESYPAFREALGRTADVVGSLLAAPPPDIDSPSASDLWNLLRAGRRFRALGVRDQYRLLRWLSMPAADFVHEWFEDDLLCAAIVAPGLSGTMLGPRSAGSTLVLLLHEAHRRLAGDVIAVRGGPGALTGAMAAAARAAGAVIHTGTPVERVLVRNGRVEAVRVGGRDVPARIVVSAVDPGTTFLRLVDPIDLPPEFISQARNYRTSGTLAKINLALSALPSFPGTDASALSGRIHVGPSLDYLERAFDRAKYGELPDHPWLEMSIPSILDVDLAPRGAHVASIYVHYAPFLLRNARWDTSRERVLASVLATLERHSPGITQLVVASQVITPQDLETEYGFSGGHPFHGELALDQLFAMRPLLGYGRYDSPLAGLYLCSAGTHPGGFLTGGSGRLAARQILKTAN